MHLRTLLVHVDSDDQFDARLALACAIAQAHTARVLLQYVLQPPSTGLMYADAVPAQVIQAEIAAEKERAANLRARIADKMASKSVAWEWRTLNGSTQEVIAKAGAVADVIVMGQDKEDRASLVPAVALSSGRPVLCVPHSGTFLTCGRRILLAWNGTRESARAAHDALPVMQRADNVILLAAVSETEPCASLMDAAAHLAAHGVKIEVKRTPLGELDAGTTILNAITETGADMLVMGAYGHSRLREWAFGGATRTIMNCMTVPTLLSH